MRNMLDRKHPNYKQKEKHAVALVSGGMDSVTLAYLLKSKGYSLHLLTFDYGQRHVKEMEYSAQAADELEAWWSRVDIRSVGRLMRGSGSSLVDDDTEVPEGHYAEESMKKTVVPNRNAIMLAIAYAAAISEGAHLVGAAMHAGDHFIYPDCRVDFAEAFREMEYEAQDTPILDRVVDDGTGVPDQNAGVVHLYTPFIEASKADIIALAEIKCLGIDYSKTWSCYKGGDKHCGRCGTCVERAEAFHIAGVNDPTEYEDAEYWKTVTKAD